VAADDRRGTRRRRAAAAPEPALAQLGPRSILVRSATWKATTDIPASELEDWSRRQHTAWYRRRRSRDLVLLTMLYEHRYLTTEHLYALFFTSLRSAQLRLRWLAVEQRLVMRWPHYEPVATGPGPAPNLWGLRQRSSVFLLTDLGAGLVATYRKLDVKAAVRRSFYTAERERTLDHSLETNGFWVGLAAAARDLPDQGLYHWVGDDAMRRNHQERGADLAPDGWGRYLVAGEEVRFSLEWDRGTEPPQRLGQKAAAHLALAAGGNVLMVVPGATREASVRAAIARVLPERPTVRFWTAPARLLRERGPLGPVWLQVGVGGDRGSLAELPRRPGVGLRVEDCIAKPGWWERRPGGGEGA
jgi:Replication-relaxation